VWKDEHEQTETETVASVFSFQKRRKNNNWKILFFVFLKTETTVSG